MSHLSGVKAGLVVETVQPVDNATSFSVGVDAPSGTQVGRLTFGAQLVDGDTVMYKAVSLQDATKWEVGLGTYVAASKTLTRTRVVASSNANAAVDFKTPSAIAPQNSAGPILLTGLPFTASQAAAVVYTVTNHTDAYSLNESAATLAQVANTVGTLINSLKQAGIIG